MRLPIDLISLAFATAWSFADTPFASAALVNVTIDDTLGDERTGAQIVYEPPNVWQTGQNCTNCTAKLDRSQLQNGTWHEGLFSSISENGGVANQLLTATAAFEGVAVFVYCAVAHTFNMPIGRSAMTFYIDNELVGHFTQETTGNPNVQFNFLVYSNTTLSSGNHTIVIENGVLDDEESLTLLDYILYTRDNNSAPSPSQAGSSLTPSATSPADSSSSSSGMDSRRSSPTRTIVIATVASIGGILLIVALIAVIICFGRRRYRNYTPPPATGVIAQDAARIEEEDAGTSGWVEGTWAGDDDSTTHSSRRTNSSKRKRGGSGARSPIPPVPVPPSQIFSPGKVEGPTIPPSTVTGVQTFRIAPSQMSHARADPMPLSPTSSFGNLTSTVPDSATYLLTPASSAAFPRYPNSNNLNMNPSDTFLDMGRTPDADLGLTSLAAHSHSHSHSHAHPTHPFATAQAVAPSSYPRQRTGRDRSDSDQSNRSNRSNRSFVPHAPITVPPNASSGALAAASRGHARPPAKKSSGSDLAGASDSANLHAGPPASVALQSLSSAATTPTSTTALLPKRQPAQGDAVRTTPSGKTGAGASQSQSQSQSQSHSRSQQQQQQSSSQQAQQQSRQRSDSRSQARTPPPRRVDPVDPAMQPPRDAVEGERERERRRERDRDQREQERDRGREREQARAPRPTQPQPQPQTQMQPQPQGEARGAEVQRQRSDRRRGLLVAERDRSRLGNFLDVPVDAGEGDSRPPSYRDS